MTWVIVLAITKLFMVYQYETPYTQWPVIEVVASCQQWQIRVTDLDRSTMVALKKYYTIKDKWWERNKCFYLQ